MFSISRYMDLLHYGGEQTDFEEKFFFLTI